MPSNQIPAPGQWAAMNLNPGGVNTISGTTIATDHWLDIEADQWAGNWAATNLIDSEEQEPESDPEPEVTDEELNDIEEDSSGESTDVPIVGPSGQVMWHADPLAPAIPQPPSTQPFSGDIVFSPKYGNKYDMTDKEEFYNKKINKVLTFKNGRQKGDIGLEIECEGTHLFRTPFKYWSCHEDGSLRSTGDHMPVEYVLKVPVPKEEVRDALRYLDEKLKAAGSKIVMSPRTSVHVHVNCQDMTVRELYCYLGMYMIFEEILVEWSGPDRAGNLFCLRAKDSDFYVKMLESVLKEKNFKGWRDDYRYAACNVASMPKFGSLEFRSMKGTVDVEMIASWVDILLMLKEAALRYDNPVEIVEDFISVGPLPFFRQIFTDSKHRELFSGIQGMSGKLWDGLRLFRDIAYSSDWKKPLEKKKAQDEPEQENEKVLAGDMFLAPGANQLREVQVVDHGRWYITTALGAEHFAYTVPPGSCMYYITGLQGLGSTYLLVDVREGPPEFRDQQ